MIRSSVRARLLGAFAVVVAILGVTAVIAVVEVRQLTDAHHDVTSHSVPEMRHLLDALVATEAAAADERGFLLSGNGAFIREFEGQMSKADRSLDSAKEIADPEERASIESTEQLVRQWAAAVRKTFQLWENDPGAARGAALGTNRDLRMEFQELLTAEVERAVAETRESERRFDATAGRSVRLLVLGVLLGAALAAFVGVRVSRSVVGRLHAVADTTHRVAAGDLDARVPAIGVDEIGDLGQAVNAMAASLNATVSRLDSEVARAGFATRLGTALDRADDEEAVLRVTRTALGAIDADMPAELLLADSSVAHLNVVAINPGAGGPGCSVDSPQGCPAVRAGRPLVFESSRALDACHMLTNRPEGAVSAVCAPVTFMGRGIGVLHATGPDEVVPASTSQESLRALGEQLGARLGTVRALNTAESQARTDALTGLVNRRETENRLRHLASTGQVFATAMIDLDCFKNLNDTHGHEAGDRALRLFAMAAREAVRSGDLIGRWGGEEFLLAMPADASTCAETVGRIRRGLEVTVALAKAPGFTLSAGVSDSTMASTVESQIRIADRALLEAKAAGRDQVIVGQPAHQPESRSESDDVEKVPAAAQD